MNYFEKHLGDYIKDTVSLSMMEDGAYNRLIDQAYQTEAPLPLDVKEIYRMARSTSTAERKAVDYVLAKFWTRTDGGYVQKRIQAEIERFQDKQRKAKASADARWNKSKGNANASTSHDASDMRTHSERNALQSPVTSHQSPDLKTLRSSHASTIGGAAPENRDDDSDQDQSSPQAPPGRAAQIAILLRQQGVKPMTGQHPRALEWAGNPKITDALLSDAMDQARQYKPHGDIHPNYLAPIVAEKLDPPAPRADSSWRFSTQATDAKGRELGMQAKPTETYDAYRDRIQAEINARRRKPSPPTEGAPA